MAILEDSSALMRADTWKEILEVVEGFSRLQVDGMAKPLNINTEIRPSLPTSEECIRNLAAKAPQSSSIDGLKVRIDHLRQRVLLGYTETISQMTTLRGHTGTDDWDLQRIHCRSLEAWFDRALDELLVAHTKQPDFSIRNTVSMKRPSHFIQTIVAKTRSNKNSD